MKPLLDNGTPAPLRRYLGDHEIRTAAQLGWATLTNGDLLARAEEAGYEVPITTDQSIRFQQNLAGGGIGIVVLMEARWPYVRLRTADIREAIKAVQPGEAREVPIRLDKQRLQQRIRGVRVELHVDTSRHVVG